MFKHPKHPYNPVDNSDGADSVPVGCSRKSCIVPYKATAYACLWTRFSTTGGFSSCEVLCEQGAVFAQCLRRAHICNGSTHIAHTTNHRTYKVPFFKPQLVRPCFPAGNASYRGVLTLHYYREAQATTSQSFHPERINNYSNYPFRSYCGDYVYF